MYLSQQIGVHPSKAAFTFQLALHSIILHLHNVFPDIIVMHLYKEHRAAEILILPDVALYCNKEVI